VVEAGGAGGVVVVVGLGTVEMPCGKATVCADGDVREEEDGGERGGGGLV